VRHTLVRAVVLLAWLVLAGARAADVWQECTGGDLTKSVTACTEIITRGRETGDSLKVPYLARARAHAQLGAFDKAISDVDAAIGLNPKDAESYVEKASIFRLKGDPETALTEIVKAIEINPQLARAFEERARIYQLMGERDRAADDEKTAKRLTMEAIRLTEKAQEGLEAAKIWAKRETERAMRLAEKTEAERKAAKEAEAKRKAAIEAETKRLTDEDRDHKPIPLPEDGIVPNLRRAPPTVAQGDSEIGRELGKGVNDAAEAFAKAEPKAAKEAEAKRPWTETRRHRAQRRRFSMRRMERKGGKENRKFKFKLAPWQTAAKKSYEIVPVFFGTDRKKARGTQRVAFAGTRARKLTLGQATVTVPTHHTPTAIERPWSFSVLGFKVIEGSEDVRLHFTIRDIRLLSRENFIKAARQQLGAAKTFKGHAFVFVHGYNVTFDNALYRTAQIAYDLGFDGVPFLYSWPSGGGLTGYLYDRDSAAQSVGYLRQFIELVATESKATRVHLIAHSMGNVPLLHALEKIRLTGGLKGGAALSQIILAAPDIDRDVFEMLATEISSVSQGVTLYASSADKALLASGTIAGGMLRAGDVPPPPSEPLVVKGVETIDVTATSTDFFGLNHSGFAEKAELLSDVRLLLKEGTHPPDKRGKTMERVTQGTAVFWRYRAAPPGVEPAVPK
jgi:esterase/lipase superfamily enzyme/tetratricopeptide (TPR) repeat protein